MCTLHRVHHTYHRVRRICQWVSPCGSPTAEPLRCAGWPAPRGGWGGRQCLHTHTETNRQTDGWQHTHRKKRWPNLITCRAVRQYKVIQDWVLQSGIPLLWWWWVVWWVAHLLPSVDQQHTKARLYTQYDGLRFADYVRMYMWVYVHVLTSVVWWAVCINGHTSLWSMTEKCDKQWQIGGLQALGQSDIVLESRC